MYVLRNTTATTTRVDWPGEHKISIFKRRPVARSGMELAYTPQKKRTWTATPTTHDARNASSVSSHPEAEKGKARHEVCIYTETSRLPHAWRSAVARCAPRCPMSHAHHPHPNPHADNVPGRRRRATGSLSGGGVDDDIAKDPIRRPELCMRGSGGPGERGVWKEIFPLLAPPPHPCLQSFIVAEGKSICFVAERAGTRGERLRWLGVEPREPQIPQ